jgi:hypothetical protein
LLFCLWSFFSLNWRRRTLFEFFAFSYFIKKIRFSRLAGIALAISGCAAGGIAGGGGGGGGAVGTMMSAATGA